MTDQQLLQQVQRRVLEPGVGGTLFRSGTWTVAEVLGYARTRQQAFLAASHAKLGLAQIATVVDTSAVDLPDDWIATVLPVWRTVAGAYRPLALGDRFEADHALGTGQATSGRPQLFVDGHNDSLQGHLIPAPDEAGTLFLYYIPTGPPIGIDGDTLLFTDDLARCALQWGLLAEMLGRIGRAHDPVRAATAQHKFELAAVATQILLGGFA